MRFVACSILALAMAVAAPRSAHAFEATVTSSTSASTQTGLTTVTYTVTVPSGETLQDFHIMPANGAGKKVKGTPVPDSGPNGPDHWVATTNGHGHCWRRGSSSQAQSVVGPATVEFQVTIPTGKFKDGLVQWATTNDNDTDPAHAWSSGPGEGAPSTHGPIAAAVLPQEEAPLGATTSLPMDSTEGGRSYTYFVVGSNPASAPDPEEDYAAFVAWTQLNPVPSSWNLVFSDLTGTTDVNGDTSDPEVSVPNNPLILGLTFWVVAVVDAEPQGENLTYKLASAPRQVILTN
ncbi:MAG: hypothetical protein R3F05_02150 [Planctomycetota bacterium]